MAPLWAGFLLSLTLCLDLGLVNVAVLRTALQRGGHAGLAVGLGSCLGDLVYFGLATLGAAVVLRWAPVRWAFWLGGTAVLLVLAWRMAREVVRPRRLDLDQGDAPPRSGGMRLFGWGVSLALASPSAILWFAAVGGGVIASLGGDRRHLWPFAAGFILAGVAWSAVLSYAAAGLRRVLGRRLVRALALVSALLFLYFAAAVFLQGLEELP